MAPAPEVSPKPSRARILLASAVVAGTILGVWALIEYRTQPPAPPTTMENDQR